MVSISISLNLRGDKAKWVVNPHPHCLPIRVGSAQQKVTTKSSHGESAFSSCATTCEDCPHKAKRAEPTFQNLAQAFFDLAEERLSDTQKFVLRRSAELLRCHELTVTGLADLLSERSDVPYSTAKWNLRTLMDMGLLEGGNSENKGLPAKLTNSAELLAEYLG
jgi:hypothetical protein